MKLLTIGEFARAARLSPKALRLYDDLGLLRPHAVDKWSGYRYYSPDQLERARLVAWLRRLGMPLAQIGAAYRATPAQVALAFLLTRPGVIAIPKSGTPSHVEENARAADLTLSAADLDALDAASPPPRRKQPLEML